MFLFLFWKGIDTYSEINCSLFNSTTFFHPIRCANFEARMLDIVQWTKFPSFSVGFRRQWMDRCSQINGSLLPPLTIFFNHSNQLAGQLYFFHKNTCSAADSISILVNFLPNIWKLKTYFRVEKRAEIYHLPEHELTLKSSIFFFLQTLSNLSSSCSVTICAFEWWLWVYCKISVVFLKIMINAFFYKFAAQRLFLTNVSCRPMVGARTSGATTITGEAKCSSHILDFELLIKSVISYFQFLTFLIAYFRFVRSKKLKYVLTRTPGRATTMEEEATFLISKF